MDLHAQTCVALERWQASLLQLGGGAPKPDADETPRALANTSAVEEENQASEAEKMYRAYTLQYWS